MKKALITGVALGAIFLAGSASAQQTVAERITRPPNVPLVVGGAAVLGAAYIPSFVVAAASPNSDDHWLFFPVFGPWIDLATRGCPRDCVSDGGNKFLLVSDGILQAVGAAGLIAGYFLPRGSLPVIGGKKPDSPRVQLTPMHLGRGTSVGAGVVGTF